MEERSWVCQLQDTLNCTKGYTGVQDLELKTEVANTEVADGEVANAEVVHADQMVSDMAPEQMVW